MPLFFMRSALHPTRPLHQLCQALELFSRPLLSITNAKIAMSISNDALQKVRMIPSERAQHIMP